MVKIIKKDHNKILKLISKFLKTGNKDYLAKIDRETKLHIVLEDPKFYESILYKYEYCGSSRKIKMIRNDVKRLLDTPLEKLTKTEVYFFLNLIKKRIKAEEHYLLKLYESVYSCEEVEEILNKAIKKMEINYD